ncbi:hypothetical protein J6590_086479 [Homalodisca vitripennis]|nr:hypothetical protein J6590_086479 [Homalodisca vitripennis]
MPAAAMSELVTGSFLSESRTNNPWRDYRNLGKSTNISRTTNDAERLQPITTAHHWQSRHHLLTDSPQRDHSNVYTVCSDRL